MVEYTKDPDGLVHVVMPGRGNEFTFCDRAAADGDYLTGGFFPESHNGPANCQACRDAVDELRESIRGVRWAKPKNERKRDDSEA